MSSRKKKKMVKLDDAMTSCLAILKQIQNKPEAAPFAEPVDWQYYGLTDYPEIIKTPMDLGTIQEKIESGRSTVDEFVNDVRLVWKNAMKYNRPDSEIYQTAEKLNKFTEKKLSKVRSGPEPGDSSPGGDDEPRRKKIPDKGLARKEDRVLFSKMVTQLSSDELGALVDRIAKESPEAMNEDDDDEVEIEINNINGPLLSELNTFMTKCVSKKARS